jgi:DNA-binding CsgD family transcriptional regulator
LRAAQQLHATEPEQASRTLLDALYAGLVAGGPASTETLLGIVRTLRTWEVTALSPPTTTDLILDGFAARLTAGYPAAAPILRAAVTRLVTGDPALDTAPSLLTMGCWAAGDLLDGQAQRALLARLTGPSTSDASGGLESGDIAALGPVGVPGQYDLVAQAWRGREADARPAVTEHIRTSIEAGAGLGATTAQYAMAILELGMGRYGAALTSALSVYRDDPPHLGTHVLPELVEAAVRSGNRNAATAALERLTVRALASRTQLAAGLLARSRALSADSAEAESRYHEAIEHLREPAGAAQLARTHLVYGEWLRRQRRRRDAREQLHAAADMFGALGFQAFAQRARSELLATGERLGKRTGEATDLTPQETQVARLVIEGSSNRQVAAQLFISPNTVEYHLQKVFRKVGVSSRTQLARTLFDQASGGDRTRDAAAMAQR